MSDSSPIARMERHTLFCSFSPANIGPYSLYIGGADDVEEGKGKETEVGNTKTYARHTELYG